MSAQMRELPTVARRRDRLFDVPDGLRRPGHACARSKKAPSRPRPRPPPPAATKAPELTKAPQAIGLLVHGGDQAAIPLVFHEAHQETDALRHRPDVGRAAAIDAQRHGERFVDGIPAQHPPLGAFGIKLGQGLVRDDCEWRDDLRQQRLMI